MGLRWSPTSIKVATITLLILLASCSQGSPDLKEEPLIIKTETPQVLEVSPTPEEMIVTVEGPDITWSSIGPGGGGKLPSLAYAPPNTIYVGCDVGGVFRSTDGGESFSIINNGLQNYVVLAIAVHPEIPTTVFLGTAGGIYRSLDAGDRWEWMRDGFPAIEPSSFSAPITSLAIDHSNPDIIYAGTGDSNHHIHGQGRIYKSEDNGEHWRIVNNGQANLHPDAIVYSILVHPQESNTLLASTDHGVYLSSDSGVNWEPTNTGLPHTNARKMVMDPTNPNTLYLTINSTPNEHPWLGGVYKSLDGGETWQPKINGLGKHVGDPGDPDLITTNFENILINPQDPTVLYVGAISWWDAGVYMTTNGGDNWRNIVNGGNVTAGWIARDDWGNPQVESMLIDPNNPQRIFFGSAWQLFRTEDAGSTWQQVYSNEIPVGSGSWQGRGLETTVLYDIEVDPTNSDVVYFGFWDIGFHRTDDGGMTFKRFSEGLEHPGNIFAIEIDPDRPNVIYASTGRWEWTTGDVVKSEDYGETWQVIGNPTSGLPDSQVYALVLDPTSPVDSRTLFAASYLNGVFKSTDGGITWVEMNNGLGTNGNLLVSSLVMDPTDPDVLFAGVDMEKAWLGAIQGDQHGGVYMTRDGAVSWTKVDQDMPNVLALSIDPNNPQVIYAATREFWDHVNEIGYEGGVYKSTDGGESWFLVFEDSFVNVVVADPHTPNAVYAGTNDHPYHDQSTGNGLFRSMDGGETWQSVNKGLSHLGIRALEIDPNNPTALYLGTSGNGLFKGHIQE